MNLKRLITIVLAMLIFVLPMTAFASAESLPANYYGNVDYLMNIKNPEAAVSSTSNKVCVISAVANPGTTVTLYSYDSATGRYNKMYSDGKALESVVGAAGLYAQNITLKSGTNYILVVASQNGYSETARLEITLLKNSAGDNIRNILQTIIK